MRNPLPLLHDLWSGFALGARVARQGRRRLGADIWRILAAVAIDRAFRRRGPFHARVEGADVAYRNPGAFLFVLREIVVGGCYDVSIHNAALIVDAGANIGMATLSLARQHPGARLLAFEPDPRTFELLQRNVIANGLAERVSLHQVALGARDGTAQWQPDLRSVLARVADAESPVGETVPVRRLSSFLHLPVDLLKLDVEGAEVDVLEDLSASRTIELVDQLVVEVHLGPDAPPRLTRVLQILDSNEFEYSVRAGWVMLGGRQDVLVSARKRN